MSAETAGSRRPNVLVVVTDQQRADHNGYLGNQMVRTPYLDAVAARGTVFENAWVANPVCMPNRSSIMTGRLPSAHGVIFNDRSLEWGAGTHVRQFRAEGWRTALIGKSHLQHGMSRNATFPARGAAAIDHGYGTGWDTWEDAERYEDDPPELPDDFYGFGHVELSIDHGARVSGHHLRWALDRGGRYEDLVVPLTADAPRRRGSDRWWQIYDPPYDEELHSTNFVTDRTIAFVREAVAAGDPFYVWASFPDPHHPMTPPGRWFDRHDPADMELPGTRSDPLDRAPAYLRQLQQGTAADQLAWVLPFGASDADLVREAIAATYGMIELVDDGVGRILSAIEALGQLDDTIVVLTADHGDMMGDHGLMLKGSMPFNGTQRVPLVVADPRRGSGRSTSPASSIDLAPTLLELAEVTPNDGIQGRSLVPVLDDPSAAVRDHVLVEDDLRPRTARILGVPHRIRTIVADDGTKLTRFSTGESILFDLAEDPDELHELGHADPARLAAANDRLLDAVLLATDDARGAPVR
ncbi:MAG: sulfatase-like hydrolase/transferase [Actinomycetota bacterium]